MAQRVSVVCLAFPLIQHRDVDDSLREIGLAKKIVVAQRSCAHVLVGPHILDIGLGGGARAPNRGNLVGLTRNDAINGLIDRRHGSARWSVRLPLRLGSISRLYL